MWARAFFLALVMGTLLQPTQALADRVSVEEPWRTCSTDSDCISVDTDCDECCIYDAMNKAQLSLFTQRKHATCTTHSYTCDCLVDDSQQPTCVQGHCRMTLKE